MQELMCKRQKGRDVPVAPQQPKRVHLYFPLGVRHSGEVGSASGSSSTTPMLISAAAGGVPTGLTPHQGQLVYHYHKEGMAQLDHCTVTPKASYLWNAKLTFVQFLPDEKLGIGWDAVAEHQRAEEGEVVVEVPDEAVKGVCLGDESANCGNELSA
ncbi:hypothetical protein VNO78_07573 [Psophocarpus tetragonolobus]|uniref:Uncharacterized protein n=1 Tax=Psophocarpus tetragonolobus TaxID=3891 RepID=A0AAN9SVJ4_PSOTE